MINLTSCGDRLFEFATRSKNFLITVTAFEVKDGPRNEKNARSE